MNNNFEQQWDKLSQRCPKGICPKTDEEIDQIISCIVSENITEIHDHGKKLWSWYWSLAVACIAGLVIVITLPSKNDELPLVKVNGSEVYYLSNSNCSAENTIDMFNSLID